MRCNNCGWGNPSENLKCEKCNAVLTTSLTHEEPPVPSSKNNNLGKTVLEGYQEKKFNKTVLESDKIEKETGILANTCSGCDYPVKANDHSCPNCGLKFYKEENKEIIQPTIQKKTMAGTIDPWRKVPEEEKTIEGCCSLELVAHENEDSPDVQPVFYTGNKIVLNRDNTDKENHTITSKEQAALTYEDGKWYLEDKSIMKTTFLYVVKKIEIQSDDVIVLGNRRFIFKDESIKEQ